jgi:hypothetical protein
VIERGGTRFGVFGLLGKEAQFYTTGAGAVSFSDAIETAKETVKRHRQLGMCRLTVPMAGFARDQGYEGPPPFRWDEEDRLRRRARLDALFFHLYGLDREQAEYVLGTFPIVRRQEEARWDRFRSRELILGYMAALAAGAADADVAG